MLKACHYIFIMGLLVWANVAAALQELKIGVGNFPPFFIEKEQKGIFIDITNAIFKQLPEYQVKYIFMSNYRLLHEINSGKILDVACNIFPDSKITAYLSRPLFRYRDVAVSRKESHLVINTIDDLQGKSIAAYQGAKELLGKKFRQAVKNNRQYSEYAHPSETTSLLLSGYKEIRIGDVNIFWHDLKNEHYRHDDYADPDRYQVHYLWPDVYSHMAFKDDTLRDSVNDVINTLERQGVFEAIYRKYQLH